jgi:hypothetical protein
MVRAGGEKYFVFDNFRVIYIITHRKLSTIYTCHDMCILCRKTSFESHENGFEFFKIVPDTCPSQFFN